MVWLEGLLFWHWWIAALVLVMLEALSPGVYFIWMAVAAGVVGLVMMLFPNLGWEFQLLVFAMVTVASVVFWRLVLSRYPTETDQPRLNRRGEQYIDRLFTLEVPVVNGVGKIKVDDSTWKVEGQDCEKGTRVRVVGVNGVVLKIEVDN
ncbi:MAG: NfeD family protein [Gammaproteobacteria bacterium]|nr:NfeD family protein [Gammaproteobacteria bacterium]